MEGHWSGKGCGVLPDRGGHLAHPAPLYPLQGGAAVMPKQKKMWDNVLTVIMSVLCVKNYSTAHPAAETAQTAAATARIWISRLLP